MKNTVTDEDDRNDFGKFDKVMGGFLAVPYQELQKKLEKDRKKKSPQEAD